MTNLPHYIQGGFNPLLSKLEQWVETTLDFKALK